MRLTVLIIVFLNSFSLFAQLTDSFVDSVFQNINKPESVNLGVLVLKNDSVVFMKNYGYTDIKNKIKADDNTLYHLSELSKQFTSVVIFKLKSEGKLSLNDDIAKYLVGMPSWAKQVKIDHLLNHTSGIPDYKNYFGNSKLRSITAEDVMQYVIKIDTLLFNPGSRFSLSGTDYVILAKIIEKITKTSFADYLEKQVFKPLGMNNSYVYRTKKMKMKPFLTYTYRGDSLISTETTKNFKYQIGNEGIFTTLSDYAKWDIALNTNKTITETDYKTLLLSRTSKTAYGWYNNMNYYTPYYYNPGADNYNTNFLVKIPSDKITILILGNRNGIFDLRKKSFMLARKISKVPYTIKDM